MSMRVKELITLLQQMPPTKEVYYSDNNEFLDIDNVTNQSDRLAPQGGLVILGFDMKKEVNNEWNYKQVSSETVSQSSK